MSGIERIAAERQRQIDDEGWTREHDDRHRAGSLALAAASYALHAAGREGVDFWPWEPDAWNPGPTDLRCLEKAGALIAAEIDRLLRKEAAAEHPETRGTP